MLGNKLKAALALLARKALSGAEAYGLGPYLKHVGIPHQTTSEKLLNKAKLYAYEKYHVLKDLLTP